ncbi:MAG TPA: Rrf2 family transcriptional regulator [Bacillota bacterium]|jgi:Rrf2 family cysteine metabolism transcriptional repressor|nr:Rrf2 family transcriptional regulator [Bacillota bacterium]HOA35036.1 Rrf2 family transcriptional regulator [Bacillota bacterium]HOJ83688.1 Rrf2 family transcriptional regulator [Bacillota bacterium]HOL15987.1 Rrf2 family transcriptional regulator [Bacillota bacterium]HPZ10945.1 Rrf2 family transcriptional regulator [Bacillota bacterium]
MKLSARVEYGVRAMAVLALHDGLGPLSLKEIAKSEKISYQFLEQIFPDLRKAGLVGSVRGARGGYYLARPPEQINIGDIVRAVEGPIAPVDCLADDNAGREPCCHRGEACRTRHVWEKLRDRINEVLDSVYLNDLIESKPEPLVK